MEEKHFFRSRLQYSSFKYNLVDLKATLLKFFEQETEKVFSYFPQQNQELWGFHKQGISIHMQTEYADEKTPDNLRFIDLLLLSDIAKTSDLEDRLGSIAADSKKR